MGLAVGLRAHRCRAASRGNEDEPQRTQSARRCEWPQPRLPLGPPSQACSFVVVSIWTPPSSTPGFAESLFPAWPQLFYNISYRPAAHCEETPAAILVVFFAWRGSEAAMRRRCSIHCLPAVSLLAFRSVSSNLGRTVTLFRGRSTLGGGGGGQTRPSQKCFFIFIALRSCFRSSIGNKRLPLRYLNKNNTFSRGGRLREGEGTHLLANAKRRGGSMASQRGRFRPEIHLRRSSPARAPPPTGSR